MADGAPERDRYLPFNLCTVMPFESNAAALQALPTVQPRPPAGHSLLPAFAALDAPLDHGTRDLMMDIVKETAEGEYDFFYLHRFLFCIVRCALSLI